MEIKYEGLVYPSVEHAYQAAKTLDPEIRKNIQCVFSPAEAKRIGKRLQLRSDWDDIKVELMLGLLALKFEDPVLSSKLLDTGDAMLIEGNYWHDNFWGVCCCDQCHGKGKNMLGKLLMTLRTGIKAVAEKYAEELERQRTEISDECQES